MGDFMMNLRLAALPAAIAGVLFAGQAQAADSAEERIRRLEEKLKLLERKLELKEQTSEEKARQTNQDLRQKILILERKREIDQAQAAEKEKNAPKIEAGEKGFALKSADGDFQVKLRGYIQADGRFFMDDSGDRGTDEFILRRVRPIIDGGLFKYVDFRFAPDFGGGQSRIFDAFLDLHYFPQASLTAGKFKPPISLERLQSATALLFAERSFPDALTPRRDVGLMLHGHFPYPGSAVEYSLPPGATEFFNYQVGVFNGAGDSGFGDGDSDDNKEYVARLFAHPFSHSGIAPLEGLGIGVAGSYNEPDGTSLNRLRTPGQNTLLRYGDDVTADGRHYRIYPQAYYYYGPFGGLAEWVLSSQWLRNAAGQRDRQENRAWQVALSYVLTGEDASYKTVKPSHPFNPFTGHWGAFQVAARYSELHVDEDTFPLFADLSQSARRAQAWAVGLNWYLNNNVKLMADYEQTEFDGGAAGGDRPHEKVFFSRFQVAF